MVTSLSFEPAGVQAGASLTATFSGLNLGSKTYFDIRFRRPGSTVDEVALDWQQGLSAKHTLAENTASGAWTVTGVRAHDDVNDRSGDFAPVSSTLTVSARPF